MLVELHARPFSYPDSRLWCLAAAKEAASNEIIEIILIIRYHNTRSRTLLKIASKLFDLKPIRIRKGISVTHTWMFDSSALESSASLIDHSLSAFEIQLWIQ